jgi:disulfide bond formation protein DsbB
MARFLNTLRTNPQRIFALIALACIAMLGFGLYLQHVIGLEPCPMCIVQRYALIGVAVTAAIAALCKPRWALLSTGFLAAAFALFGAFVAARQSWLQWYPPEVVTCGRDFYGIIENTPMRRAIPMIFKGSGDCTKVDWTFLGGSIANWSFVCFVVLTAVSLYGIDRALKTAAKASS